MSSNTLIPIEIGSRELIHALNSGDSPSVALQLKGTPSITVLSLEGSTLGDIGACTLSRCLHNLQLTYLNVSYNHIGLVGVRELAVFMGKHPTLWNLSLESNPLLDPGALAISTMLQINTILTHLNLTKTQIGNPGAQSLSRALRGNGTLRSLHLQTNLIGDNGAEAFSEDLSENSTLTHLNLGMNNVGREGAKALRALLENTTTLTFVSVMNEESVLPRRKSNLVSGLARQNLILLENAQTTLFRICQEAIEDAAYHEGE